MAYNRCFYFDGFKLTANESTRLVEIERTDEHFASLNKIEDLPHWVFDSRLAIWFTQSSASIYHKSLARQKILNLLGLR